MRKGKVGKRWFGIIGISFCVCLFCMSAEARFMLPNSVYEKYKEDLDGDGKKEKIVEKNDCLYINGKKILSLSDTDCEFIYWYICDFWKNDNVKEIAILSYPKKFTIYRYKKNKLVKFASENGKNDVFRYMVTDHFIKVPGNGTLVLSQMLYNEKSYQIIGNIFLTLKVSKGKIRIDQNKIHDISNEYNLKTKGKKTYVYMYP